MDALIPLPSGDPSDWGRYTLAHARATLAHAQGRGPSVAPADRGLVDAVSAVLFAADPVGIAVEQNADEYDSEAETIVAALPSVAGRDDLLALVHATFRAWFSPDPAFVGAQARYEQVADAVWDVVHRSEF